MPVTTLQKLRWHSCLDATMRYVALTDQRIQADYEQAVASFTHSQLDFDWSVWGAMLEEAVLRDAQHKSSEPLPSATAMVAN